MLKIKQFFESDLGKDIVVILIIVLTALMSFGLGRLSQNCSNSGLKVKFEGEIPKADI